RLCRENVHNGGAQLLIPPRSTSSLKIVAVVRYHRQLQECDAAVYAGVDFSHRSPCSNQISELGLRHAESDLVFLRKGDDSQLAERGLCPCLISNAQLHGHDLPCKTVTRHAV